jgi:hypothetical protein
MRGYDEPFPVRPVPWWRQPRTHNLALLAAAGVLALLFCALGG